MEKYIVASVRAGNKGFCLQKSVSSFEDATDMEVFDEDGEINLFVEDEIEEYTLDYFERNRCEMLIEEDKDIVFTGFEIKDQSDEDIF